MQEVVIVFDCLNFILSKNKIQSCIQAKTTMRTSMVLEMQTTNEMLDCTGRSVEYFNIFLIGQKVCSSF